MRVCVCVTQREREVGSKISGKTKVVQSKNECNIGVMGWLSGQSVGLEIQRSRVRILSGAQERVKKVVLTCCQCAQPPCVYARIRKIVYAYNIKDPVVHVGVWWTMETHK